MMKNARCFQLLPAAIALLAGAICDLPVLAAAGDQPAPARATKYLEPHTLTGTIYDLQSKQVLFTFKRTATNSANTVQVLREYFLPGGTLAARERVVYRAGHLADYRVEDLQCGDHGGAKIHADAGNTAEKKATFEYLYQGQKKSGAEKYQHDILITDMVVPFILDNWNALMKGATVKCRLLSLARAETVGFRLVKDSEATVRGKRVVIVRMEAASFIVAQFIDPLYFTLEKEGERRVLQYSGRITPAVRKKGKWEDVDALTVFDWK